MYEDQERKIININVTDNETLSPDKILSHDLEWLHGVKNECKLFLETLIY